MYKYPITKNNREYAINIYQDPFYVAGFKVKLYIKRKVFCFKYDSCIEEDFYSYDQNDKGYDELLKSKTLYKIFAEWIITKYEKRTYKENLFIENENSFEEWDGKL
jgi:hypothetical protein